MPLVDKKTRDSVAVFTSPGPGALLDAAAPFLPRTTARHTPPLLPRYRHRLRCRCRRYRHHLPPTRAASSFAAASSCLSRALSLFPSLSSFVILLRASRDVLRDPADTTPASLLHSTCLPDTVKLHAKLTLVDLRYRDRRGCPDVYYN